jgi:hypothetical protein
MSVAKKIVELEVRQGQIREMYKGHEYFPAMKDIRSKLPHINSTSFTMLRHCAIDVRTVAFISCQSICCNVVTGRSFLMRTRCSFCNRFRHELISESAVLFFLSIYFLHNLLKNFDSVFHLSDITFQILAVAKFVVVDLTMFHP